MKSNNENEYKDELRQAMICILTKKRTLKDVCQNMGGKNGIPKREKTMRALIKKAIEDKDEELIGMYRKYKGNYSERNRGYNYAEEIITMLELDLSQRAVSEMYNISRNTLKDAIKRMAENDPELGKILKIHLERHSHGRNCTPLSGSELEKLEEKLHFFKEKYGIKDKFTPKELDEKGE